jgi:L-iditol 2-dehydrogenase
MLASDPPGRADPGPPSDGARGATRPANASLIQRVTRGRGLDAAVIAVPSDVVVSQAQAWLRGGGQLLLFAHTRRAVSPRNPQPGRSGFPLDLASVCVDEKDLLGSYSSDFTLQTEVARLVFSRWLDVRPLITHRFPLEQTADAVRLAAQPAADSLKTVILPTQGV